MPCSEGAASWRSWRVIANGRGALALPISMIAGLEQKSCDIRVPGTASTAAQGGGRGAVTRCMAEPHGGRAAVRDAGQGRHAGASLAARDGPRPVRAAAVRRAGRGPRCLPPASRGQLPPRPRRGQIAQQGGLVVLKPAYPPALRGHCRLSLASRPGPAGARPGLLAVCARRGPAHLAHALFERLLAGDRLAHRAARSAFSSSSEAMRSPSRA